MTPRHFGVEVKAAADTGITSAVYQILSCTRWLRKWQSGDWLGLFIAKSIVELHNGAIEVKSKKDVGSVFTIKLPKFDAVELEKAQQSADKLL